MKTLNDVINAVQHETQLSRSQLSLKIGKSRNYLNTTVKTGLSYEKEQEVIALLLGLVDDETTMLRSENARISSINIEFNDLIIELNKNISSYKTKLKEVINENLDIVKEKNDEIATKNLFIDGLDMENKGLMDNIDYLNREVKLLNSEKEKLIKDSHKLRSKLQDQIDCTTAINEDNEKLSTKVKDLEKTIESLKKSNEILGNDIQLKAKKINSLLEEDHPTRKQLDKEITKNRILTASIIGLVAIFSVYLWVK